MPHAISKPVPDIHHYYPQTLIGFGLSRAERPVPSIRPEDDSQPGPTVPSIIARPPRDLNLAGAAAAGQASFSAQFKAYAPVPA
jgi:hypothetical protein